VSKLCCPVCWEFLKVLRKKFRPSDASGTDPEIFCVRDHHDTFYLVGLPDWLPQDIVQEMVHRFKDILWRELLEVVPRPTTKKGRRPSFLSELDLSTGGIIPSHPPKPLQNPAKLTRQDRRRPPKESRRSTRADSNPGSPKPKASRSDTQWTKAGVQHPTKTPLAGRPPWK
jgi:hypothetical protein